MADFYRFHCTHCGELCKGSHCAKCKTKEGRAEVDRLNAEIKQENLAKGYNYNA